MISYIKLKNFISLNDICFDFQKTKTQIKKFAAIYGENGSGKTNFIKSLQFLINSLTSFNSVRVMNLLQEKIDSGEINSKFQSVINDISNLGILREFTEFMKNCRTIDCTSPSEVL